MVWGFSAWYNLIAQAIIAMQVPQYVQHDNELELIPCCCWRAMTASFRKYRAGLQSGGRGWQSLPSETGSLQGVHRSPG